jgi:hypothetical protein
VTTELTQTGEPQLLATQAATLFDLTESGRLRRENSPDRSPAPRLWLAGSTAGNVVRLRDDVPSRIAHAVEALARRERPLAEADAVPAHLDDYVELLGVEGSVEAVSRSLTYAVPSPLRYEHAVHVVASGSPDGETLYAQLAAEGMPAALAELGFVDAGHLWPPWCAALDAGAIVSVAFAARLSSLGAEVGVVTIPSSRGRGFAAAATAGWASLPSLRDRVRLYSTDLRNVSSRRVAERLRLPFVGSSLWIR